MIDQCPLRGDGRSLLDRGPDGKRLKNTLSPLPRNASAGLSLSQNVGSQQAIPCRLQRSIS